MTGPTNRQAANKMLKVAGAVCAALALLIIVLIVAAPRHTYLRLSEVKSGRIVCQEQLDEGAEFSVSYTHSVNRAEVEEFYQRRGSDFYVVRLIYDTFGAGMTTDAYADGGSVFYYDEEGNFVIEGYDICLTGMVYNVGTIADHILHINNKDIHLNTLAQPQSALRFTLVELKPWQAWLM